MRALYGCQDSCRYEAADHSEMRGTLATCPDCGCQGRFSRPKILPVDFHKKILRLEELAAWRAGLRDSVKKLVVTNGCFDLIHIGHVTYLQAARGQGDALLVGLNGDASVRALKGPGRPINSEGDRAGVLAALESVDAVCIFPEDRATAFLRLAKPDIYVKGGDYTPETLNAEERSAVESGGGRIVIVPVVPGKSTTRLLQRLAQ